VPVALPATLLAGDTPRPFVVELGVGERYVQQHGEDIGVLQTYDPRTQEVLDNEPARIATDGNGRFEVLTEEQRRRQQQPITTPALPPGNGSPPPLPITDRFEPTPGYAVTPPAAGTPGMGAAPPVTVDDLIMQSARNYNRGIADERFRDNPSLQDPSTLAGRPGTGGIGIWGYPETPRTPGGGTEYQEQLNGVPNGLELNVGGRIDAQGNISGGAWLDGSEVRDGQVVLIDRKDWSQSTVDLHSQSWNKNTEMLEEIDRQLNAARATGATIEWQFSDKGVADTIRQVLKNAGVEDINVVFVPR
jgi:hypothetical protein